ncbi:unnamed protein product [Victoria cruziana]
MEPHGDRKPAVRRMPDLFMMMLPDFLRYCPDYVPEDLRRQYLQDPDAHRRKWNSDGPSLQLGTQSDPVVLDEAEMDTAAVQVSGDHLRQGSDHNRTCVPSAPPAVETHAPMDADAPPSSPPQLRHVVVSPSPQLASRRSNDMDEAFEQRRQSVSPVFPELHLLDDIESELLSEDVRADLDCSTLTLLLKKKLTSTDTNLSQCRLSLPKSNLLCSRILLPPCFGSKKSICLTRGMGSRSPPSIKN